MQGFLTANFTFQLRKGNSICSKHFQTRTHKFWQFAHLQATVVFTAIIKVLTLLRSSVYTIELCNTPTFLYNIRWNWKHYFRHYYISTSLGDGRRTRTSSKFRREAYTMGDLTLVTYIGDEREASTQHSKDLLRAPQPPASLQVGNRVGKYPKTSWQRTIYHVERKKSFTVHFVMPKKHNQKRTNYVLL